MAELSPPTPEDGWDVHLAYSLVAPVIEELLERVAKLERDLAAEKLWRTPLGVPVLDHYDDVKVMFPSRMGSTQYLEVRRMAENVDD